MYPGCCASGYAHTLGFVVILESMFLESRTSHSPASEPLIGFFVGIFVCVLVLIEYEPKISAVFHLLPKQYVHHEMCGLLHHPHPGSVPASKETYNEYLSPLHFSA
eukprot:1281882-Amphidinium_carterae.4